MQGAIQMVCFTFFMCNLEWSKVIYLWSQWLVDHRSYTDLLHQWHHTVTVLSLYCSKTATFIAVQCSVKFTTEGWVAKLTDRLDW